MTEPLDLGCFSVSLGVADLDRSLAFYEALGFTVLGGEDRWRILGNGTARLGIFEGELEGHILTFNPGIAQDWPDEEGVTKAAGPGGGDGLPTPLPNFTDVRTIEQRLLAAGIELTRRTETPEGPDHIVLVDPDGNQIMVDQFF